ncbi:MAG: hypothetical protein H7263_14160 [Candidatus Sericytochromatia bacterium]|nr:hypothetical protein [Candidatus Sericytochromatia bacterium]
MKIKKLALTLSILVFLLSCQTDNTNNNGVKPSPISSPTSNPSNVDITNKKNPVINIGEKKYFLKDLVKINSLDFFDADRALISLDDGDVLSLENQEIKSIESITNIVSSVSLNSSGNGLIFSIDGKKNLTDGFEKNKLYMSRVKNYKITEKNILIDDQVSGAHQPISYIDNNGNGFFIYPSDITYIRQINNYNISENVKQINSYDSFVKDQENILRLFSDDNYTNFKVSEINLKNNTESKGITINSNQFYRYYTIKEYDHSVSVLFQGINGDLELARIYAPNNITKTKLSGLFNQTLRTFYINKEGNGFIFGEVKEGLAIIKVKNFSLDTKDQIIYQQDHSADFFSYVSPTNDKGYLIWKDQGYRLQYLKFEIINQ